MDKMNDDVFRKMKESLSSPEIQGCLAVIESIAGYKVNAADRQPFLYFHNYVTDPQPEFLSKWRSDPHQERWYHRFLNGFLGDVQNTLACVLYHHGRLNAIESAVLENIEKYDYRRVLGNSTVALGNTLVWDFEYQAFVLAYRRCLDYLARAICTYFMNDFHSFRRLDAFLKDRKPETISTLLISLHKKYVPMFEFVLSEGNRKSLRDKISHYEYVPVGVINLSRRGFVLAGGGEQLGGVPFQGPLMLSEVIDSHVNDLRACIREIIYRFVDSIRIEQAKHSV